RTLKVPCNAPASSGAAAWCATQPLSALAVLLRGALLDLLHRQLWPIYHGAASGIPMYPDFLETLLRIFWEGSGKVLGSFWEFSGLYRRDERHARERRRTSPTSYFPNIVLP